MLRFSPEDSGAEVNSDISAQGVLTRLHDVLGQVT